MLRQAKGLDAIPPEPRRRRAKYPTLETTLPCIFPAVQIQPDMLAAEGPSARKEGKPELICKFCERVKGWQSIVGFWTHLVSKHKYDVPADERLSEVKRTADLWKTYWTRYSDGGKRDNSTMAKLKQVESPTFSWQDVENWGLRY